MKFIALLISFALAMMLLVSCDGQPKQTETVDSEPKQSDTAVPENSLSKDETSEDEQIDNDNPEDESAEEEDPENEPVEELSRKELVKQLWTLMSELVDQYTITSWGTEYYPETDEPYCSIGCLTQEDVNSLRDYLIELGYDSDLFHVSVQDYKNPC